MSKRKQKDCFEILGHILFFPFSLLFSALCVKCESVCVHVCACHSIFILQTRRLSALFCSNMSHRLHTWKLVYVRAHARASVPLFQRWKPCASASPRQHTDVCESKVMCADFFFFFFCRICHVTGTLCREEIDAYRINKTVSQISEIKPVGELRARLQLQLGPLLLILSVCASQLSLSLSLPFSVKHTHTHTQLIAPVIALFSHEASECNLLPLFPPSHI